MTEHPHSAEHLSPEPEHLAHVSPAWLLLATFFALLVLTAITVAVTWFDLGAWNLWLAMAIATAKAMLVALFFMHLAFDKPINALYLLVALVFVGIFVAVALLDTIHYQPGITQFLQAVP